MRAVFALILFVFAAALAACGGGSHGSIVPSSGTPGGGGNNSAPSSAKSTRATISIFVPSANKQASRKRLYVPTDTAAFGIFVTPYPSGTPYAIPSAMPAGIQIFPAATPSPCVSASGGMSCSLTVTAPIGNDLFVIAALKDASPSPNDVPLSVYVNTAPIAISASAAPGATPIPFVLNGIVYYVAISVPSPDPGNSPNTQVFTALASQTATLGIQAYDADNQYVVSPATQAFYSPIVISASPASKGVTLSLANPSQCGSTASGATATIACAGDLNDLQVSYDGTTHPDSSDHAIDAFVIAATAQPSPAPAPATIVLASNVVSWPISGMTNASGGFLFPYNSTSMAYVVTNYSNAYAGSFTYSTGALSSQATISGLYDPVSIAVGPSGTVWAVDNNDGSTVIDCWSTLSDLVAGDPPNSSDFTPLYVGDSLYVAGITVDPQNNVWFDAYDENSGGNTYLGEFPQSGTSCTPGTVSYVSIEGTYQQSSALAPLTQHAGVVLNSLDGGLYVATTANLGGSAQNVAVLNSGYSAAPSSIAVDATETAYGVFGSTYGDLESVPYGGSPSSLLTLVPSTSVDDYTSDPAFLSLFSSSGSAADRAIYADLDFYMLGVIGNLGSSPTTQLVSLGSPDNILATLYGPNGQQYALYEPGTNGTRLPAIARAVNTHTWSVPPSTQSMYLGCDPTGFFSVNERQGDSFTVTNVTGGTITPFAASSHDFVIDADTLPTTMTATIADGNGRAQALTFVLSGSTGC